MILLQNSLPCTENFYRYQKNFEKYVNTGEQKTETKKVIASPGTIKSLSPVASLAKKEGVNFNPPSHKNLLRYAVNKNEVSKDLPDEEPQAELDDNGVPKSLP